MTDARRVLAELEADWSIHVGETYAELLELERFDADLPPIGGLEDVKKLARLHELREVREALDAFPPTDWWK